MITSISARSSGRHARVVSVVTALAVATLILLAGNVAISSAYEGVFCHKVKLAGNGGYCQSNEETETRRAVGRSEGGYTGIYIYATNGEEKANYCYTESCEVGTGYLAHDDTVAGVIEDVGANSHIYYGYLYH